MVQFHSKPIGSASIGKDDATIGQEIDLLVTYKPLKGVKFNYGYSLFRPDGVGTEIAGADPTHFGYVWMIVNR